MRGITEIDLTVVSNMLSEGGCAIIFDQGDWNGALEAAYQSGWILIESKDEIPVRAYRRIPN